MGCRSRMQTVQPITFAGRSVVGSKVVIEVIETDAPDPPVRRYRSDREVQESPYSDEEIEQLEREELRRLKAKFEPGHGDE